MTSDTLRSQVHEKLRSHTQAHPWLQDILAGRMPTPPDETAAVNGLIALGGGVMDALDLIAGEIDKLKGHTHPSQG